MCVYDDMSVDELANNDGVYLLQMGACYTLPADIALNPQRDSLGRLYPDIAYALDQHAEDLDLTALDIHSEDTDASDVLDVILRKLM